ncbi:hypothetical protein MVEN_00319200 [Mycena venus]|uniref:Uncharacterized protein n=1 Tax=Mycena venus TaxID=2733690 RepID=A0A8H6YV99_9AGAR|nr:hypothetical protein MVEN_00319200 [Mycena venus]
MDNLDLLTLIRKIAVLLNDFIAHQDIVICDNVKTIQYTSSEPTFYFGQNPTCGLHKRTKDGDKKFFQAYDSQMALDIIPGMHSEETSHFLDIVIHLNAEVAKSLTVVEFMGYLIDAMNELESPDSDDEAKPPKLCELIGEVFEFDGVDLKIDTRKNKVQVVGKWKRTSLRRRKVTCEKCQQWLAEN